MSEIVVNSSALERYSDLLANPMRALDEVLSGLKVGDGLIHRIREHFVLLIDVNEKSGADAAKSNFFQEAYADIQDELLANGHDEEAGLLFNIHRVLTRFSGYGADARASSDVAAFFGDQNFEINDEGLLLVEGFAVRNLAEIVRICEERGGDQLVSRIRVCDTKAVVAAALLTMSDGKRAEFERALVKLGPDQVMIEDQLSSSSIGDDLFLRGQESVAIWFAPRVYPISPELMGESEGETIANYSAYFLRKTRFVLSGGRLFVNMAFPRGGEWQPLQTESAPSRSGDRVLTKLSGISESVSKFVVSALLEVGFEYLPKEGDGNYDPTIVDPNVDHVKMAKWMHLRRKTV